MNMLYISIYDGMVVDDTVVVSPAEFIAVTTHIFFIYSVFVDGLLTACLRDLSGNIIYPGLLCLALYFN